MGCRVSKGLGPLRVALGGLARLIRRLHAEMRLLERGAPGRRVPPRLFERLLERAQVGLFLAHAAQRRAALPLPGGVHLLGHGLQLRVRLLELGGAGKTSPLEGVVEAIPGVIGKIKDLVGKKNSDSADESDDAE